MPFSWGVWVNFTTFCLTFIYFNCKFNFKINSLALVVAPLSRVRVHLSPIHAFIHSLTLSFSPCARPVLPDGASVPSETLQEHGRARSRRPRSPTRARGDQQNDRSDHRRRRSSRPLAPPVTASAPLDPSTGFPTASRPTGAGGDRRSRRRHRRRHSSSDSDSSRARGARSSSSSRSRSPRGRSGNLDRCMSPGGKTVSSIWGGDTKDQGLDPNPFSLQEWRRARRLPMDPQNPPQVGERNP